MSDSTKGKRKADDSPDIRTLATNGTPTKSSSPLNGNSKKQKPTPEVHAPKFDSSTNATEQLNNSMGTRVNSNNNPLSRSGSTGPKKLVIKELKGTLLLLLILTHFVLYRLSRSREPFAHSLFHDIRFSIQHGQPYLRILKRKLG
jgi:hypothetical protein